MQDRIAPLVREAATFDAIADGLARGATVHIRMGHRFGARTLLRMCREHRVKALMRRCQAAANLGRELPSIGPVIR